LILKLLGVSAVEFFRDLPHFCNEALTLLNLGGGDVLGCTGEEWFQDVNAVLSEVLLGYPEVLICYF